MEVIINSHYAKFARESLEYFLKTGKEMEVPSDFKDMLIQAGAFVTIKKNGESRGCMGTCFPVKSNVGLEIIHNAIRAGTQDPRFWPVSLDEFKDVSFSVDIISTPEKNVKIDDLNPFEYGVIINTEKKQSILLPTLKEIDTVEKQIKIAKSKAKISDDESFEIHRFTAVRHLEGEKE